MSDRGVDVDARTAEGTTAFAWACWRGRVDAMRWLAERGGARFGAVNAFGCNAAMWVVQGGAGLDACRYVRSLGVTFRLLNANGHSAVHKAAQRGRRDVCAWLLGRGGGDDGDDGDADAIVENDAPESEAEAEAAWARALVGSAHLAPDNEGFTPADHARLAGDARLAAWLRARQREASARERARFILSCDGINDSINDETRVTAVALHESRGGTTRGIVGFATRPEWRRPTLRLRFTAPPRWATFTSSTKYWTPTLTTSTRTTEPARLCTSR